MTRALRRGADGLTFIVEVVERFFEDESPKLAAALAYYAIFSIPPLLVILIASVQALFAQEQVDAILQPLTSTLLSERVASEVLTLSGRAREWARSGPWWSVTLSVGGVLFAATRGLAELHSTLNRIWGIAPDPERSAAKNFLVKRFTAFLMLCGLSVMLVVSIIVDTVLEVWGGQILELVSVPFLLTFAPLQGLLSIAVVCAILTVIYRLLPDAKITTQNVLPGALFTAVLFEIAKDAFSYFISRLELGEFFGQASSLMALLVWLYMCGLLVALGAEFTQVWTLRSLGPAEPEEGTTKQQPRTMVVTRQLSRFLDRWRPSH